MVPDEFVALVRSYTRGLALAPVVRIQTSRRVLRLLDDTGQPLAEIAADHVLAEPADGSAATSWDEIEAELVTGRPALLEVIDLQLTRHAPAGEVVLAYVRDKVAPPFPRVFSGVLILPRHQ